MRMPFFFEGTPRAEGRGSVREAVAHPKARVQGVERGRMVDHVTVLFAPVRQRIPFTCCITPMVTTYGLFSIT